MENKNNTGCTRLPHFCSEGIEKPVAVQKPGNAVSVFAENPKTRSAQQPWSIFGDVYWL